MSVERRVLDFGKHGTVAILYVSKDKIDQFIDANRDFFPEVIEPGWWWAFCENGLDIIDFHTDYFGPYYKYSDVLQAFVSNAIDANEGVFPSN